MTSQIQSKAIASSAVTYSKIQNGTASTLLGNPTGSAAAPSEITLGTNLSFSGSVLNATSGGSAPAATYNSAGTITREATWTSYTPTIGSSFGTVSGLNAFYKVLGDTLYLAITFVSGSVGASVGTITIPTLFTISSTNSPLTSGSFGNTVGTIITNGASAYMLTFPGTSTSLIYTSASIAAGSGFLTQTAVDAIFGNGVTVVITAQVPIV